MLNRTFSRTHFQKITRYLHQQTKYSYPDISDFRYIFISSRNLYGINTLVHYFPKAYLLLNSSIVLPFAPVDTN